MTINPRAIYEGSVGKDGVITPVTKGFLLTIGTANQLLVTAVAGKIIQVLRVVHGSATGVASYIVLRSSTAAGAGLVTYNCAPNTLPSAVDSNDFGIADTVAGEGLYVDCGAGAAVFLSIKYLIYTP